MKYLVLFFLASTSTAAGSVQDEYIKSCEATFQRVIASRQPEKAAEAKKLGKESCADMAKHLSEANKWSTVKKPKLDACSDAIYMMADDALKEDRKAREKMTLVYCF